MPTYRIISAQHSCCFESRVEKATEELVGDQWECVAEFYNETDAQEYVKLLNRKEQNASTI